MLPKKKRYKEKRKLIAHLLLELKRLDAANKKSASLNRLTASDFMRIGDVCKFLETGDLLRNENGTIIDVTGLPKKIAYGIRRKEMIKIADKLKQLNYTGELNIC